ncbi:sigma-70 family RNA polymerase sigma factor [Streptomyces sp. NPDC006645]|uniref:sigma-70 family RNA polymerase sigma factor n=1 Tax=unclassified Streptomyces TaxID=2593676 RepID=UPI0033A9D590
MSAGAPDRAGGADGSYFSEMTAAQHQELRGKLLHHVARFTQMPKASHEELVDDAITEAVGKGRVDPERQPVAYLKRCVERLVLEALSVRKVRECSSDDMALESAAVVAVRQAGLDWRELSVTAGYGDSSVWGQSAEEEIWQSSQAALRSLRAPQARQCVQLSVLDGLSPEKVAEELGIPRAQVDSQLSRARRQMREHPDVKDRVRAAHVNRKKPKDGETK